MLVLKLFANQIPILGPIVRAIYRIATRSRTRRHPFPGSAAYWESRYLSGGNSGVGSYGKFAAFKADVLNAFVEQNGIESVIEFGCGDGNQLALAKYPDYLGFDVSATAISRCRQTFRGEATKTFRAADDYEGETADLSLSLDVIYHLVEDHVFDAYMRRLFDAASRFVIVYSSNTDENEDLAGCHVRHRQFTVWVESNRKDWMLRQRIPNMHPYEGDFTNGSFADFHIFEKVG